MYFFPCKLWPSCQLFAKNACLIEKFSQGLWNAKIELGHWCSDCLIEVIFSFALLPHHHKKCFVSYATDIIKAPLCGRLAADIKIFSKGVLSLIFSTLSSVCALSDKADWIHRALTKIPFKRENGIKRHSVTPTGKHKNTPTQKAFALTYTKQHKAFFFVCLQTYIHYCSIFEPELLCC